MPDYQELAPSPRLADIVECFWISSGNCEPETCQRVVPDGCADLIYIRAGQRATLQFVAPMTRYQDFPQAAGVLSVGVRIRPAMWADVLRLNGRGLADQMLPLQEIWGRRAGELCNLLDSCEQPEQVVQVLARSLPRPQARSPFQNAITALEQSHGALPLENLATAAGLSLRQFRRRCLEATSLAPKLLARILRFRHANARSAGMLKRHAGLAAESGYADQSHWIAECRLFSGRTPCHVSLSERVNMRKS